MRRKAVLIGSGHAKGYDRLKGPAVDLVGMYDWLRSESGGAWDHTEIESFPSPKRAKVSLAISAAGECDYAFVSYFGHGRAERRKDGDGFHQYAILKDAECELAELTPAAPKCVVLCDACRCVTEPVFRKAIPPQFAPSRVRDEYRAAFDAAIESAGEGATRIYGCSVGQVCHEDWKDGGFFTNTLINCAKDWCNGCDQNTSLAIDQVFGLTLPFFARYSRYWTRPQAPTIDGDETLRGRLCPFAVALGGHAENRHRR